MLTLPIKRKWFDMICRGEKREEYREVTEYWRKRIDSARTLDYKQFKDIFEVKSAPDITRNRQQQPCGCI